MNEQWRNIIGYENYYRISDQGHVKRIATRYGNKIDRILKPWLRGAGYPFVNLSKNGESQLFSVHCLVASAFLGPCPDGKEINHKDGNPANNDIANLEYVTHQENIMHAYAVLGTVKSPISYGEANPSSKLNIQKVNQIRYIWHHHGHNLTKEALGKVFNVSGATIGNVIRCKNWEHVVSTDIQKPPSADALLAQALVLTEQSQLHGNRNPSAKLTIKQVNYIRALYAEGNHTQAELARRFEISRSQIGNIVTGKSWQLI